MSNVVNGDYTEEEKNKVLGSFAKAPENFTPVGEISKDTYYSINLNKELVEQII